MQAKVVLCGEGFVGKSTIRERYLGITFRASYLQTIGADYATKNQELEIALAGILHELADVFDGGGGRQVDGLGNRRVVESLAGLENPDLLVGVDLMGGLLIDPLQLLVGVAVELQRHQGELFPGLVYVLDLA